MPDIARHGFAGKLKAIAHLNSRLIRVRNSLPTYILQWSSRGVKRKPFLVLTRGNCGTGSVFNTVMFKRILQVNVPRRVVNHLASTLPSISVPFLFLFQPKTHRPAFFCSVGTPAGNAVQKLSAVAHTVSMLWLRSLASEQRRMILFLAIQCTIQSTALFELI
eukprot:6171952-Pleurochrysis_carterae.AAC.3